MSYGSKNPWEERTASALCFYYTNLHFQAEKKILLGCCLLKRIGELKAVWVDD